MSYLFASYRNELNNFRRQTVKDVDELRKIIGTDVKDIKDLVRDIRNEKTEGHREMENRFNNSIASIKRDIENINNRLFPYRKNND